MKYFQSSFNSKTHALNQKTKKKFERFDKHLIENFKYTIRSTMESSKFRTTESAMELYSNLRHNAEFLLGFEAIFGYRDGHCVEKCSFPRWLFKIENRHLNSDTLTCYECIQFAFNDILYKISSGMKYREIEKLDFLLCEFSTAYLWERYFITDDSRPPLFKENFEPFVRFNISNLYSDEKQLANGDWVEPAFRGKFVGFLLSISALSLREFLRNNDRRKLKKCVNCKKYFIAAKVNPKQKKCPACSRKTSMSLERQREYQRALRKKQKEEKDSKRLEKRIANLMKLDYSREEALEIIEADSML